MSKTVFEVLSWASSFLVEHGREETAARLLLQYVLQKNYSELMMAMQEPTKPEHILQFQEMIERHVKGEPVQYIIGVEEFYGRPFEVNESVLIPRPETEELVVGAIERMKKLFDGHTMIKIADIGTGSGVIAITTKLEYPSAQIIATDISQQALQVAKKNAQRLKADIAIRHGDLTQPLQGEKWDVILSNPPYISYEESQQMSEVVLEYEPHQALFAENNGLALYERMIATLPNLVKQRALIGFEIGHQQGQAVSERLRDQFPQAMVEIVKDINGKDRIAFCTVDE